jgi:replicative DNA helicase
LLAARGGVWIPFAMIDSIESAGGGSAPADLKKTRRRKEALLVDPAKIDRLPPHSIEAEQGVLGCLLLDPQQCLGECASKLKQGNAYFYDLRHQTIYELLLEMYDAKVGIDLVTVAQRLKDKNQLDAVGGLTYLASLADAVPSAANLTHYLDIVWDKYILRKMIRTCTEFVGRAYDYQDEVNVLVDEVETDILRINEEKEAARAKAATIKDLVNKAVGQIELFYGNKGATTGLATGFTDFDKMTTGLHPGDMVVIAARPSMGKTSLAMNIAEHVALEVRQPVGVFSLEMTADSLVLRLLCSNARVNLRSIREGFIAERDFPRLTAAAGRLANAPLFIDDTSGLSILQLRAKARRMHQQHGIKLFVIDYLQLLHSTSRRADNRQQEIADISNGIKALAKELGVPVIVLAQLNRDIEKREPGAKPRLSDLRESGSIEQDADLVGLLYREKKDEDDEASEHDAVPTNLLIAKQRNGPTGDVPLVFLRSITRYESASKVSAEDAPAYSPEV